jgi:hypothetical protein
MIHNKIKYQILLLKGKNLNLIKNILKLNLHHKLNKKIIKIRRHKWKRKLQRIIGNCGMIMF